MLKKIAIYIRRNIINGKSYVGQSVDPWGRWYSENYEKSVLGRAISKYGKDTFDSKVLFWVYSQEAANWWERYLIQLHDTLAPDGYNVRDGGSQGNSFAGKSATEMAVINGKKSQAMSGKNHWSWGKNLSEEHRAKIGTGNTGKKPSIEQRAKMSEATRGKKKSAEHCRKISQARRGKRKVKKSLTLAIPF